MKTTCNLATLPITPSPIQLQITIGITQPHPPRVWIGFMRFLFLSHSSFLSSSDEYKQNHTHTILCLSMCASVCPFSLCVFVCVPSACLTTKTNNTQTHTHVPIDDDDDDDETQKGWLYVRHPAAGEEPDQGGQGARGEQVAAAHARNHRQDEGIFLLVLYTIHSHPEAGNRREENVRATEQ